MTEALKLVADWEADYEMEPQAHSFWVALPDKNLTLHCTKLAYGMEIEAFATDDHDHYDDGKVRDQVFIRYPPPHSPG